MTENATIDVRIKASPELLREMTKGWSRPLQVKAELSSSGGEWSFAFRVPETEIACRKIVEAARKVIDPSEKLLTHKPRDWGAVSALEVALDEWDAQIQS
jgi:hypothetical protein